MVSRMNENTDLAAGPTDLPPSCCLSADMLLFRNCMISVDKWDDIVTVVSPPVNTPTPEYYSAVSLGAIGEADLPDSGAGGAGLFAPLKSLETVL